MIFSDLARRGSKNFRVNATANPVQAAQRPQGLALTAMEEIRSAVRCKAALPLAPPGDARLGWAFDLMTFWLLR